MIRKAEQSRRKQSRRKRKGEWPTLLGRSQRTRCAPRTAFTLIELLVVIAILGILSALLLGVAARAGERAREARTKSMIARIHPLVAQYYDTYKNRRAPLSANVVTAINDATNDSTTRRKRGQLLAEARLYALRELMIMEMPDRWSDVLLSGISDPPASVVPQSSVYLKSTSNSTFGGPTPLVEAYRRQYYAMAQSGATAEAITANQGAECLYMMVMIATSDGEARSLFHERDIGDVDGDGAPEFLDGWGRPISFLRWAPGFESDLQANANLLGDWSNPAWIAAARDDHDPFDTFRSDPNAFRVVPLIFSAGSDEEYGIHTIKDSVTWVRGAPYEPFVGSFRKLSPYKRYPDNNGYFLGTISDASAAADNITNHDITSE